MNQAVLNVQNLISDVPEEFAIIEHPNQSLEICIGPFESSSGVVSDRKNIFFSDFLLKAEKKFFVPAFSIIITSKDRLAFKDRSNYENPGLNWEDANQHEFAKAFKLFFNAIRNQDLIKAVPICFTKTQLKSPKELFPCLISKVIKGQAGLYSYAFKTKDFFMIGASPEILFNLDNKNLLLTSEAVAGSILGPSAPIRRLTDKLLEEQQLVVQDLSQQLSLFGEVQVSEVKLKNLSSLCHLKSDLTVNLRQQVKAEQIIAALHPSGALGLLPRKELEHHYMKSLDSSGSRLSFGAPFGIIDRDGSSQIVVAIRNIIVEGSHAKIGAGVGITSKSEFASELEEIQAKHSAVMNFFGLANDSY